MEHGDHYHQGDRCPCRFSGKMSAAVGKQITIPGVKKRPMGQDGSFPEPGKKKKE